MTAFAPIVAPAEIRAAVDERAWFGAMLEAEQALAAAGAAAGIVPAEGSGSGGRMLPRRALRPRFDPRRGTRGSQPRGLGSPAPTKPLRMLVGWRTPFRRARSRARAAVTCERTSLRRSTTTSLLSKTVVSGSLAKRTVSTSTGTLRP